jgi:hypothetical protein
MGFCFLIDETLHHVEMSLLTFERLSSLLDAAFHTATVGSAKTWKNHRGPAWGADECRCSSLRSRL